MRTEVPEFKRCCWCIPLRYGLLAWTVVKLITNVVTMIATGLSISMREEYREQAVHLIYYVTYPILIIDAVFCAVFIAGAIRKEVKLMKVFYIYCMVLWVVMAVLSMIALGYFGYLIFVICYFFGLMQEFIKITLMELAGTFVYFVVQSYYIMLIKSEMQKLNNIGDFHFVNHAAEAACTMKIDQDFTEVQIESDDVEKHNKAQQAHHNNTENLDPVKDKPPRYSQINTAEIVSHL